MERTHRVSYSVHVESNISNMGGCVSTLERSNSPPVIVMRDSSLSCLSASNKPNFIVEAIDTSIDDALTEVDETSCLKYRTPHFRARAEVLIPHLANTQVWQIGWIQACDKMEFINTYGEDGHTSWEFPELISGKQKMISDSDGTHYPWYGSRTEVKTVHGPCHMKRVTVSVSDNFYPKITWKIPLLPEKSAYLTRVSRDQSFYTWLVAKNLIANRIYVLKTIRWEMSLDIKVDVTKPIGKRATLVGPMTQKQPEILENDVAIPAIALLEPNANSAQRLVWRGTDGGFSVIVPPRLRNYKCPPDCLICCTQGTSTDRIQTEMKNKAVQIEVEEHAPRAPTSDVNGNTAPTDVPKITSIPTGESVNPPSKKLSRSPISNSG
ncbi:protein FAM78B [Lingula anatina]|uniref:Protein FAM78B n=1 Tax=Lingula anatina TaxID=7574 RepID=A0A1S3KCY6_LINAN|nr:protein FAM78B [Lingula anatina]|eukprot:XP_013420362.1 protein FAM78B [Lingula anatina]